MFSPTELELMDQYLTDYGTPIHVSVEDYLKEWHKQKSKYLLPLFDNKLIHELPISYTKDSTIVAHDLTSLFDSCEWIDMMYDLELLLRSVLSPIDNKEFFHFFREFRDSIPYFRENRIFDGPIKTNTIDSPLRKPIVIQQNQKPFRAINLIVKMCEPYFDDPNKHTILEDLHKNIEICRIRHSRILNDGDIKGTLCLSIHPMDYLTMSDNACNWESCMTWTRGIEDGDPDPGEYRVGTVEMMNSPSVVVAYIKSKHPYFPCPSLDTPWSNKKWRELFIVDKDFISGIHQYPYQADPIETIVLEKLKEIAEARGYSAYNHDIKTTESNHRVYLNEKYFFYFETKMMYNDYMCHPCRYLTTSLPLDIKRFNWFNHGCLFNYSGDAYCLSCGRKLRISTDRAEQVVCMECSGQVVCEECGMLLDEDDDQFDINGATYCMDCISTCEVCGNPAADSTITDISIGDSDLIRFCPDCMDYFAPYIKDNALSLDVPDDMLSELPWYTRQVIFKERGEIRPQENP